MMIRRPRVYDLVKLAEFLKISEENLDTILTTWISYLKDPKIIFNIASEKKEIIGGILVCDNQIVWIRGTNEITTKLLSKLTENVRIILTTEQETTEYTQLGFKIKYYILEKESE